MDESDNMPSGAHDRPNGLSRPQRPAAGRRFVHRHTALVRVAHWINVVCLLVLLHDAPRDSSAVVVLKLVSIEGLRPGAQAGDRDDAIFNSGIDDDWRDARHVDEFRLYDTQRDARRDTRVDRVAARL